MKDNMKRFFYSILTLTAIVGMVGCKDNNGSFNAEPQVLEPPSEGSVVYSELLKDGKVIEQCIDSIVNLGDKDNPAIFYLNQSHTIHGTEIPRNEVGMKGVFTSVTRQELDAFIAMYAQVQSIPSDTALTEHQSVNAYQHLANYAREHNIEVAQLVHLAMREPSLLQPTLGCGTIIPAKGPQDVLPSFPTYPLHPEDGIPGSPDQWPYTPYSPCYPIVESKQYTYPMDSIMTTIELKRDGVHKPFTIMYTDQVVGDASMCDLNTYVSYYNKYDTDSRKYTENKDFKSPVYTCRYGTKGHPMVLLEFCVEGTYNSKHKGDIKTVCYIPFLKTVVKNKHVGFTMYLDGKVLYNQPELRSTMDSERGMMYAIIGGGEIEITYGDSWMVERLARLRFTVDALTGFQQNSWDDNE